jgi:hypothetical protein
MEGVQKYRSTDVQKNVAIERMVAATPLFLQNPAALIHKNLKLPKWNSKS